MSEATQKVGGKAKVDSRPSIRELDERTAAQVLDDTERSVNKVLLPDPNGKLKMKFPLMRDPEPPHKMMTEERTFREVEVPHTEVLYYTHGVIMDRNTSHSDTVQIGNQRRGHVFDRTYTYNGKIYHRCAWIPDQVERAGILFKKMINRQTRRPVAVLKKIGGTNDPMYQIIGAGTPEYRDLRRIFERFFIKKQRDAADDELDRFSYDAIGPQSFEATDEAPSE